MSFEEAIDTPRRTGETDDGNADGAVTSQSRRTPETLDFPRSDRSAGLR